MTEIEIPSVAMLHHVSDHSEWRDLKPFLICWDKLMRFLDAVEASGRRTANFEALSQAKNAEASVTTNLDDCCKNLLDFAAPELIQRRMKVVFFMPTAHTGKTNSFDVAQGRSAFDFLGVWDLKELRRSGMEVGGHSHRHIHVGRLDPEVLRLELAICQSTLTEVLEHPANVPAYPFGLIPAQASHAIFEHGFEFACAIFSPVQATQQLRRFIIHIRDGDRTMQLEMSPLYRWHLALMARRKNVTSWT